MARFTQSSPHLGKVRALAWRKPELQLQVLLAVAILFGGGGSAYGVYNLAVQLTALLVLALNPDRVLDFLRRAPRVFVYLGCLTLALPLVQLVPLPASVWGHLPGRDLLNETLALIGRSKEWYPLSLAPARTLIAFFSLIPVLAVSVLSWDLDRSAWRRTLRVIVAMALAVLVFGALQLFTGNDHFLIYREHVNPGMLYGTFANHNSAGLFFVLMLAMLLANGGEAGSRRLRNHEFWSLPWVRGACATILAMAVILTQSRSSMAVLLVVIGVGVVGFLARLKLPVRSKLAIFVVGCLLCAAALFGLQRSTRFSEGFGRFEDLEDVRPWIWEDTVSSAKRYWPVGSGISSFPEVFEVDETLEHLWSLHAGRAHNDYLEIAQEAGIAGLALIAAWLAWCALLAFRAWRGPRRWQGMAAASGVAVIALQSAIDYPLRNQTILCVGAVLLCLLASAARADGQPKE